MQGWEWRGWVCPFRRSPDHPQRLKSSQRSLWSLQLRRFVYECEGVGQALQTALFGVVHKGQPRGGWGRATHPAEEEQKGLREGMEGED